MTRNPKQGMPTIRAGSHGRYAHYKAEQHHRWNDGSALGPSRSAHERRQELEEAAWKEARRRTRKRENMAREVNKSSVALNRQLGGN